MALVSRCKNLNATAEPDDVRHCPKKRDSDCCRATTAGSRQLQRIALVWTVEMKISGTRPIDPSGVWGTEFDLIHVTTCYFVTAPRYPRNLRRLTDTYYYYFFSQPAQSRRHEN